ncbi:MAG: NFACT family protein [Desulfuromonadales bacterium]|nr:NFACT family protein [Desulfuromonadales bacterium]MDW7758056.1 NFACT family protein [Desulfuromonadales bacterium]
MDNFAIAAMVREVEEILPGALIRKIYQPDAETIILRLWNRHGDRRLLLSTSPRASRLHLTEKTFPNPASPPRFCQLLRARLRRLLAIEQIPGERVVQLTFAGEEDNPYRLMAELLGGRSNLILVDGEGRIVDCLKRETRSSGERALMPGNPYRLPEALSRTLLADVPLPVPEAFQQAEAFEGWLKGEIAPMTPLVARDLAAGVRLGLPAENVLESFRQRWLLEPLLPQIAEIGGRSLLLPFDVQFLEVSSQRTFASFAAAADCFYGEMEGAEGNAGGKEKMQEALRRGLRRVDRLLQKLEQEQENLAGLDRQRQLGELLVANLYRIRRGMEAVTVEDYHAEPPCPVTIGLDPLLTPQENAERYFRRVKKGKRGEVHLVRRREEARQQKEWLQEMLYALEEAETAEELTGIRSELEEAGLIRPSERWRASRRPGDPKEQVRRLQSPGGFTICWGKNNRTNDYVSRHLTAGDDLWFHARDMPGAHVVLKRGQHAGDIPTEDLLFAARIAAGYSRGKDANKVEVMVADGKAVHKPKGARPGLVTVSRFRSVLVPPLRPL